MSKTYGEYYANGPHAEHVGDLSDFGVGPFAVFNVFHPRGDYPDPPMPEFALFAVTKGNAQSHFSYGGRRMIAHCQPGTLGLAPPDVGADYTTDGPLGYVGLSLPVPVVRRFFEEGGNGSIDCLAKLHDGVFQNDALAAFLPAIATEARSGRLTADLVADSVVISVLTLLSATARPSEIRVGGARLSSHQKRLLGDYISDNLERPIRLFEMAELIGVSQSHLVRACKASFGLTPHRLVVSRRVREACGAICETTESLAAIAAQTGFASQSHMSDVIRRHTRMTPKELRNSRN